MSKKYIKPVKKSKGKELKDLTDKERQDIIDLIIIDSGYVIK